MTYEYQSYKCGNKGNFRDGGVVSGELRRLEAGCNCGKEEKIKNRASIEIETCGKKHKIESNEVEARKINLLIREEQNCNFVFAGDEIEYRVKIFNDSHIPVRNIEFDDVFNECGEYKKDSFKVNGCKEQPLVCDHHIRYRINEIKPHEEIIISFECYFK